MRTFKKSKHDQNTKRKKKPSYQSEMNKTLKQIKSNQLANFVHKMIKQFFTHIFHKIINLTLMHYHQLI